LSSRLFPNIFAVTTKNTPSSLQEKALKEFASQFLDMKSRVDFEKYLQK
jgi:hypothetical protein